MSNPVRGPRPMQRDPPPSDAHKNAGSLARVTNVHAGDPAENLRLLGTTSVSIRWYRSSVDYFPSRSESPGTARSILSLARSQASRAASLARSQVMLERPR